jgi:hypothetical protein
MRLEPCGLFGIALLLSACGAEVIQSSSSDGSTGSMGGASSQSTSTPTSTGASTTASATSGTGGSDFQSQLLGGPWLIGWWGNLDHFSWVRFLPPFEGNVGTIYVLDPSAVGFTPFFGCQGQGTFTMDAPSQTVALTLPAGCNGAQTDLIFTMFTAPATSMFPKSDLGAGIISTMNQVPLEGARFPSTVCDPAFTMCADPTQ